MTRTNVDGIRWQLQALLAAASLAISIAAPAQAPNLLGGGSASPAPPVSIPDPAALQANWWDFVAPEKDGAAERAATLISHAETAVADLPAEQAAAARQPLDRLRLSLSALPAMIKAEPPPAPPLKLAEHYTGREVLALNRQARNLQLELDERNSAYAVATRAVKEGWKQLDSAFPAYAASTSLSQRLLAGLDIMASRAELALMEAEQRLRKRENEAMAARVKDLTLLRDEALQRVTTDPERSPEKLQQLLSTNNEKLDNLREDLLRLRAERSNLSIRPDTPATQVYLADLRITAVMVEEALLTTRNGLYGTELDWLAVNDDALDTDAVVDMENRLAARLQEIKATESQIDDWSSSVQRVIANSLRLPKEELDEDALRTRAAILATAETSVTRLVRLKSVLADSRFATEITVTRLAQTAGWRGWLRTRLLSPALAGVAAADDWLGATLFRIGDAPVTTYGLLRVLVILGAALLFSRAIRALLARYSAQQPGGSSAGMYTVSRLLHYVLIAAGLVIGLASIGLDFSQLALFAGALSIGIGFGLQSIVNNFMSGLIILFEQSLKVGDVVELDSGVRGTVREIRVRSTLVSTNDGVDIIVPNAEFISGKVVNFTLREPYHRIHVPFSVAYGSDKEEVRRVVIEAADKVPFTHRDASRETDTWLVRLGDNSLDFELVVWINPSAVTRPGAVQATYLWEIETALTRHGIQIPFPQRDVRVTLSSEDAARLGPPAPGQPSVA